MSTIWESGQVENKVTFKIIILLSNPPLKPGHPDTQGQTQQIVYPPDYPDKKLCGLPKGIKVVLQEWEEAWDQLMDRCKGKVPVGKCKDCTKLQAKRDAEWRVAEAEAEAMGQEDAVTKGTLFVHKSWI